MTTTNSMNAALPFCLDPSYLMKLADQHRDAYAKAEPFPHIVIDNFLPEVVLNNILQEFPDPDRVDWQRFNTAAEDKLASKHELQMGDMTRFLLYQFNSSVFIEFLEKLTGIDGLIPDPHFAGGGLHQIRRGGFLKLHVDFNQHKQLRLDRRLNLLVYLNKDWEEEYGGHLELWDSSMTHCSKKVLPIFNRCVVFSTTDFSYHGHPEPLMCPEGRTRKSLALYYYSNGRPAEEVIDGSAHSTIFRDKAGKLVDVEKQTNPIKAVLKKVTPPIVTDIVRALKK